MPARPHRTVDRVIEILETVSLSPRGVTLAELAAALDAAKSSVQELTNGLLARGYLIEEDRRFHLGPGPFILAARANKLAALSLDHRFVAELAKVLGCTVLVGVRVGGRHRLHSPASPPPRGFADRNRPVLADRGDDRSRFADTRGLRAADARRRKEFRTPTRYVSADRGASVWGCGNHCGWWRAAQACSDIKRQVWSICRAWTCEPW